MLSDMLNILCCFCGPIIWLIVVICFETVHKYSNLKHLGFKLNLMKTKRPYTL